MRKLQLIATVAANSLIFASDLRRAGFAAP